MAFVLVIGVVTLALVQYAFTTTRTLEVYRADRIVRANGEAALSTAVRRLVANPLMATDATSSGTPPLDPGCDMDFTMLEDSANGSAPILAAGSFVQIECGPTTSFSASGPFGGASGSGGVDADGGQRARDVTITVTCRGGRANVRSTVTCGSTGTPRVVARARVRLEIDPNAPTLSERAIVPKVVNWDVSR